MKTNDLFRTGVNEIIKNIPNILQKDIAVKLNNLHASDKTAATDLNDFLKGRRDYSLDKQERLAHILGYSHLEILLHGEQILENTNKIKNFKPGKQTNFMLTAKDGSTYSITQILKMAEEFLIYDNNALQLDRSYLIESIIKKWKILLSMKKKAISQ